MAFDIIAAKREGYTDSEIADYLAGQQNFNTTAARNEGYSDQEIIGHLLSGTDAGSDQGQPWNYQGPLNPAQADVERQVKGVDWRPEAEKRRQLAIVADRPVEIIAPIPGMAAQVTGKQVGSLVKGVGDLTGIDAVKNAGESVRSLFEQRMQQTAAEYPLPEHSLAANIRSGGVSLAQNLPFMAKGAVETGRRIATGMAPEAAAAIGSRYALLPMSVGTGAETYDDRRTAGNDKLKSLGSAAVDGLLEYWTEKLPTGEALKYLGNSGKRGVAQLGKTLGIMQVEDQVGEFLATHGEELNRMIMGKPNATPEEIKQQVKDYVTQVEENGHTKFTNNTIDTMESTAAMGVFSSVPLAVGKRLMPGQTDTAALPPDESYNQTANMPAPTGPLSQAVNAAPASNLPVPVNTMRVTPTGQAMTPEQSHPLQTVGGMSPAQIEEAQQRLNAPPATAEPAPVATTNELVLDDARSWAQEQIQRGNTSVMQQQGEKPQEYANRLVAAYQRLSTPNGFNIPTAPPVMQDVASTAAPVQPPPATKPAPVAPSPATVVNPENDHLITAIVKHGGLDINEARTQFGPTFVKDNAVLLNKQAMQQRGRFGHVFKTGANSLDRMREKLVEDGYLHPDSTVADLQNMIDDATRGKHAYSQQHVPNEAELSAAEAKHLEQLYGNQATEFPFASETAQPQPAPVAAAVPAADEASQAVRSKAERYAQQRGWNIAIDQLDDAEVADFVSEYERWAKDQSRSAAPPTSIGSLIAERRNAAPAKTIDEQAHAAATSPHNDLPEPTPAQIQAGNYQKGHFSLHGLDISIENPAGSLRRGVDETGRQWETKLQDHYGYIKGTVGKDKDHLDIFVGPDPASTSVTIIDQLSTKTGKFDEHKVLAGFPDGETAQAAYLANYDETGPQRIGAASTMTVDEFKEWLAKPGSTQKPFARLTSNSATLKGKEASHDLSEVRQETVNPQEVPPVRNNDVTDEIKTQKSASGVGYQAYIQGKSGVKIVKGEPLTAFGTTEQEAVEKLQAKIKEQSDDAQPRETAQVAEPELTIDQIPADMDVKTTAETETGQTIKAPENAREAWQRLQDEISQMRLVLDCVKL